MSEDVPPSPIPASADKFNNSYFFNKSDSLDYNTADARYIRLGGNAIVNELEAYSNIDAASYSLSGVNIDFSSITGITNGTVSTNKAVIVDSNKDITGFRSIGLTGTLSMSATSPSINLSNPLTVNNSTIWTSGVQPTNTNGIGVRFIGASSTGIIRAYNYVMSSTNNIDINDGAIYIKNNANIGISNTNPQTKLHVQGALRVENSYIQVGTSTDTTRMITCLDSAMSTSTSKFITLGRSNDAYNQAELAFYYSGAGSTDNRFVLGFHSLQLMHLRSNGAISIGKAPPAEGGYFDCAYNINTDGAYRMDGTDVITSGRQFVGSGGVLTSGGVDASGRIVCRDPLGLQVFNSSQSGQECRMYCGLGYAFIGNQGGGMLLLGTGNETYIVCKKASNGRKATCIGGDSNDSYPLSVSGTTLGDTSGSTGFLNSSGNTGTTPQANSVVSIYATDRVLAKEFNAHSDLRLKKDVKHLDVDFAMRFIQEAEPKSFKYLNESTDTYGYIAQDLLKREFFDLIMMHKNDKLEETVDDEGFISPAGIEMSLQSRSIIPLLHLGLKRAFDEIDELKSVVADLICLLKKRERKSI